MSGFTLLEEIFFLFEILFVETKALHAYILYFYVCTFKMIRFYPRY